MRVRFGTRAFTSRMILGLAGASNDFSMTLKIVFSLGFSCERMDSCASARVGVYFLTSTAASSAGAAAEAGAEAEGKAISCIFSRVCETQSMSGDTRVPQR